MTDSPQNSPLAPLAQSAGPRLFSVARWLDLLGPVIALICIFLFFTSIIGSSFATFNNIQGICDQATIVCLVGIGMTFIIISGGIDLSVGSSVALCAVVAATILAMKHHDVDPATGKIFYGITNVRGEWTYEGQPFPNYRDLQHIGYATLHPVIWPSWPSASPSSSAYSPA